MIKAVDTRDTRVFDSIIIISSMFLDKRFASLLKDEQKREAKDIIQSVLRKQNPALNESYVIVVGEIEEQKGEENNLTNDSINMNTSNEYIMYGTIDSEKSQNISSVDAIGSVQLNSGTQEVMPALLRSPGSSQTLYSTMKLKSL